MGRYVFFRLDINNDGTENAWIELGQHSASQWKARINSYQGYHVPRRWEGTFWYVAAYCSDDGYWYLADENIQIIKAIPT